MAIFLDSSYWQLYTYLFCFMWLYIMMCRFNSWISAILFLMYIRNMTAWCTPNCVCSIARPIWRCNFYVLQMLRWLGNRWNEHIQWGGIGGMEDQLMLHLFYISCVYYIYICLHKSDDFLVRSTILLMEAILHHLGCMKRYKFWDICHISSCRISSISSNVRDITWMLYFLGCMLAVFTSSFSDS